MNPLVIEIQVCSNEGPHPFPRDDNSDIIIVTYNENTLMTLKFLLQASWPISTTPGTTHSWVLEICLLI